MDKSLFDNDLRIEHEIAEYLDANLYRSPLFSQAVRTPGEADQKIGCDIILSSQEFGLESAIVDEKATIHYINQDITTFAFEENILIRVLYFLFTYVCINDSV